MVCHETGRNVNLNYQTMSAAIRDPESGRVAYSNLEVSLSAAAFSKVRDDVKPELTGIIGYSFETKTGRRSPFSGSVQVSAGSTPHGDFRYLEKEIALEKLPKSAGNLIKSVEWIEQNANGSWNNADWANELYDRTNSP